MCDCEINTTSCSENTTEFEDWALDGLRKAEEMLKNQDDDSNKE